MGSKTIGRSLVNAVEGETSGSPGRSPVLKVQRTWLWGKETRRPALVLSFAAPGQVLDASLIPGTNLDAELVYFPGGFPLRALVKKQNTVPVSGIFYCRFCQLAGSLPGVLLRLLTANPWLDLYPMMLHDVTPFQAHEGWGVKDTGGCFLPIGAGFSQVWTLLALSGGTPL